METIAQAQIELQLDDSKLLRQARQSADKVGAAFRRNIAVLGGQLGRLDAVVSRLFRRLTQVGTATVFASVYKYLKTSEAGAIAFRTKLDELNSAFVKLGAKILEVRVFGRTAYEWVDILKNKVNSITTQQLERMLKIFTRIAILVGSLKVITITVRGLDSLLKLLPALQGLSGINLGGAVGTGAIAGASAGAGAGLGAKAFTSTSVAIAAVAKSAIKAATPLTALAILTEKWKDTLFRFTGVRGFKYFRYSSSEEKLKHIVKTRLDVAKENYKRFDFVLDRKALAPSRVIGKGAAATSTATTLDSSQAALAAASTSTATNVASKSVGKLATFGIAIKALGALLLKFAAIAAAIAAAVYVVIIAFGIINKLTGGALRTGLEKLGNGIKKLAKSLGKFASWLWQDEEKLRQAANEIEKSESKQQELEAAIKGFQDSYKLFNEQFNSISNNIKIWGDWLKEQFSFNEKTPTENLSRIADLQTALHGYSDNLGAIQDLFDANNLRMRQAIDEANKRGLSTDEGAFAEVIKPFKDLEEKLASALQEQEGIIESTNRELKSVMDKIIDQVLDRKDFEAKLADLQKQKYDMMQKKLDQVTMFTRDRKVSGGTVAAEGLRDMFQGGVFDFEQEKIDLQKQNIEIDKQNLDIQKEILDLDKRVAEESKNRTDYLDRIHNFTEYFKRIIGAPDAVIE